MISEGSCDTEDWSNDPRNKHSNKAVVVNCNILLDDCVYYTFDQINRSMGSRIDNSKTKRLTGSV